MGLYEFRLQHGGSRLIAGGRRRSIAEIGAKELRYFSPLLWLAVGAAILGLIALWWLSFGIPPDPRDRSGFFLLIVFGLVPVAGGLVLAIFPDLSEALERTIEGPRPLVQNPPVSKPPVRPRTMSTPRLDGATIDYSKQLTSPLRPANALLAMTRFHFDHPSADRIEVVTYLDRTGSGPSDVDLARLSDVRRRLTHDFARDHDCQRALARLNSAGVDAEIGGTGDMCGVFVVLSLTGSAQSLPLLEAMAADDMGLRGQARREAQHRFNVFMLRNYHPDWKGNRTLYSDAGPSPYHPEGVWHST